MLIGVSLTQVTCVLEMKDIFAPTLITLPQVCHPGMEQGIVRETDIGTGKHVLVRVQRYPWGPR